MNHPYLLGDYLILAVVFLHLPYNLNMVAILQIYIIIREQNNRDRILLAYIDKNNISFVTYFCYSSF